MSVLSNGQLDLSVVQAAYGPDCDLYTDVLKVERNASPESISNAYFVQRKSLFQTLAKLENAKKQTKSIRMKRKQAEQQMDAVVSAVRILGDTKLRRQYDQNIPALHDSSNSATDEEYSAYDQSEDSRPARLESSTRRPPRASKSSTRFIDQDNSSTGSTSLLSEEGTLLTYEEEKRPEGLLDRVRMEFSGALDDTSRSFEQVFNAFTLSEDDIDAVVRRIDKAKHQIGSRRRERKQRTTRR